MDGVLLVNKPRGMGSSSCVYKLRKILGTKDIGHCGTLDPLAEGLLIVTIGKALKISRFIIDERKEYIAKCKLGETTSTLDCESEVIEKKDVPALTKKEIEKALNNFKGEIEQVPPVYSAISVNGRKLYDYARNGIEVEVPSRKVKIHNIELLSYENNTIEFKVECSKGTYVRTLCKDIALHLNTIGYMSSLIRTKIDNYCIESSYTLEDIEKGDFDLISIEKALNNDFNVVVADEEDIKTIKNGNIIKKQTKGKTLYLDQLRNPLGMYEYDEENKVTKCIRIF